MELRSLSSSSVTSDMLNAAVRYSSSVDSPSTALIELKDSAFSISVML